MRTKSFILTFLMMMFCSVSFGQTSKWGIPDTHCESTMTMITKIVIDGDVQGSDVEIAAFCGGELRGTARPDVQDGNIVYLVIHGNNPEQNESAEVISFRFYDHAADRELFYPYPDIVFEDNKVIGSYSSVINGNGLINLTSIAEVNGIGYGSLDAAINAAQANNVIVLLADVVAETNPVNIPADVTLNLNTHTIKADILGTVETNGGLWVTPQDYKMIGKDADIYATNAATVITDANNITIEEGDVTLVPTEWWTAQGQNLTIDANAKFTIPQGKKFNIESNTSVTINGTVSNEGTLAIKNGATVKGNITGDIHFLGGKYITADNYNMVGTTSDYYYNTTDALVNIAGQFGDITIKSGEMTLGQSWRTVQGQTLTIASGAKFTVPANMTFEVFKNTHVIVNGTLVTDGTVYLQLNATVKAAEGLNVTTNVADHKVVYEGGVYKVVEKVYIAQTETGAKFETLQEAVNAGTTVTLLQPATGAGVVIDKDITIDFGGKTYTVNQAVGSTGTETLGFQILKDNDVTLKNGTLTSTAVTSGKEVKMLIQNYANLTLTNMNLVDNTDHILYALSNNSGNVNLDGNTNITTDAVAFDVYDYSSAGYEVPKVNVSTTGKITGAIVVSESISNNLNISAGTFTVEIEEAWCANGFIPVKNADNTWTVKVGKYVARNTTTGQGYETLVEAVAAAAADQEVKLLANVTLASSLNVNRNVVLDLNGKKISSTVTRAIHVANASLTINDVAENSGMVTTTGNAALLVGENATLVVNGGTIKAQGAIMGNGQYNGTNITINGGIIDGDGEIAIYHPQNGVLNINGGTIVGSAGVEMRAGTLNMTEGTVEATGTFATRKHDSGQTVDGVAIALSQHTTNHNVDINITGGTIKSSANGKAFYQDRLTETYTPSINITADIAATTVEGAVEAAELGYNIVENNGVYTLVYVGFEAQIGEVKYETLVEAVEAAQPDATVILLKSATGAGVVINKNITIDFATYTYTVNQAVGSAGTETLGFQILKGNTVTLKNGTLKSTTPVVTGKEVKMLIQNYANLTLTDMNLVDNTTHIQYALSNNSGTSNINGATNITTDAVAFDVYDYTAGGYAHPTVNVNTTGKITGAIEVSESISNNLNISGGLFTTAIAEAWCADGFFPTEVEIDGNTYYTVHEGLLGSGTETDPFIIRSLGELKFFRDHVNAGKTTYNVEGVHVALAANIDMATEDWSVNIGDDCNKTFDGIFDGKGYTISNLNGTETAQKADGYVCTGLFGAIYGNAVIKNLTIENVNITAGFSGNNAAAVVGFVYGDNGKTTTIENVTVKGDVNINASGVYGVGAIVGYSYEGGAVNIKNCKVVANEGSVITATSGTGAIIGYCAGRTTIDGCTVDNIDITGKGLVGGIAGITSISNTKNLTNNTVKNVNLTATKAEWVNSTAIAVGTMSGDGLTVANTIFENVNASRMVGSVYAEQPTYVVPAVEARIENKYYGTFDAALAAAQGGNTITVLVPIVITENKTYDLTGLTVAGENVYPIFRIQNNAEVTVKGEGTITNDDYVFVVGASDSSSAGNLTIESGTYIGETTVAQVTLGNLTIKGGRFSITDVEPYDYAYLINCKDANYTNGTADVKIYGGTFVGFDPENNAAEGAGTNFCADGYLSDDNGDGTYTVREGVYVAQVGDKKFESFDEAFAYAKSTTDNDAITILKTIVLSADQTIDFENIAVTSTVNPAFRITDGATVTVENGNMNTEDGGYNFILGASDGSSAGNLTIKSGKYHGATTVASVTLGALTITGGEFSVEPYEGNYAFLINCIDANYKNGTASVAITGGTFHNWNPQNNAAEGTGTDFCYVDHAATETAENVWTVLPAVAEIGEARFATLQDAVNAAQANETINLIANVQLTKFVTIDKSVNLNLGQFDITRNDGTALYVNGENIQVAIYGTGKVSGYQAVFVNNGIVTINGGNFVGNPEAVYVINNGHAVINGGRFETIDSDKRYVLNEYDATRDVTTINVYGGTFVGFDPENNAAEGAGTNFCAEGYISDDNGDGTFTVRRGEYIAQIAETGAKYETLQAAYEAANANHTIVLLQNVTLDATFAIAKGVTLNGSENNYKLTVNANGIPAVKVNTNDDVIFKNLVIESTGYNNGSQTHGVHIAKKANVTFDNVDVNSVYSVFVESSAAESVINVNNGSKLYADMSGIYAKGKVTINVTNSWVEKYYNGGSAIYVNGEYSVVNVVNSTIKATSTSNAHFAAFEIGADNVTVNVDENSKIEVINSSYDIYAFYVGDKELNNRVLTNHNIIIADGATINKNKETDPVIYIKDAEVKVTKDNVATMMYFRLIDALAVSHVEGETMTILKPVVLTENAALNIEGRTIITAENVYPAIRVQNDAEVTITGEGTIKNDDYVFVVGASDASSAGNLTIENGTYVGETTVAQVTLGKLNITGGDFSITDVETYDYAYLINCKDEYYNAGTAQVEIKGGTFHNFNPQNNAAEGAGTNFCAEGYGAYESAPNVWTVRGAVARIGDRYFAKVADATSAAVTGDIVYLLDNVNDAEVTVDLNTAKKITIDLGDFTYTSTGTAFIAYRNGTELTITNGTVNGNGAAGGTLRATYNATLILGADLTVNAGPQATAIVIQDGKFFVNPNTENVIVNGGIDCIKVQENVLEVSIASGTYTEDVQEWCPQGYVSQNNGDGTWTVTLAQIITLEERWNWVSHYVVGNTDSDILTQLKNGLGAYGVQIKNQNEFTNYNTEEQSWSGNLRATSVTDMYKVKTSLPSGETLPIQLAGAVVDPTHYPIELAVNWNYLGYPLSEPVNVGTVFSGFAKDGDYVKSQDAFAEYYNGAWHGNLKSMNPGEGYMYQRSTAGTFTYSYPSTREAVKANVTSENNYWVPASSQYANNMTMVAVLDVKGGDYEVAAFVGGEVRGSARPVYIESLDAYMFFLTIHGEEVEEMTFKCYDLATGEEYDLNNRMNYSNDAVVGSIGNPYVLSRGTTGIGESAMSEVNIYPNPTTTGSEVNLGSVCDTVEVFNALGVKIAEYQNVDAIDALETAGIYVIRITNNGNVQNCRLIVK